MSVAGDAPVDPRFAHMDANGTIELCSSLADYGEAGGLSRDLMMQVGRYAEARYGDDTEVLLALARMYLLGGEALRARAALVRAGKLGLPQARLTPLLVQVLETLDDPRTVEQVLYEAPSKPPLHGTPTPMVAVRSGAPSSPPSDAAPPPTSPAKHELRSYTPTAPMTRMPGHGPSKPTTPMARQGGPSSQAAQRRPGPVSQWPRASTAAQSAPRSAAQATPAQAVHIRTEISRRIVARDAGVTPTEEEARAPSAPSPGSLQRPARIRILDPDDERRKLDPYELIGEIASGGMATVYLGRLAGHGGFSRFVAIKQLHPHLAREEQFVQMFLDEARLAAGIHNPHVVPILEVGMSKAGYFLVMEFIEGDTLAGLTARSLSGGHILPAPVTLRIVVDALTGLHAAHQLTDGEGQHLGLVHRDCTPQNILVGADGSARITDFGVARAASRLAITRPQQVKGKVAYLSPEQAHAMDLDRRSDIFTMGIVLWEALAGRPLFQAESEAVTLSRLISGPIPSVRSIVPDVPVSLDDVCRRALYRDRNRRFRTAAEMAEALERAAEVEGFAGVASPRDLGKFVEATMGAELAAQREAVRAGLLSNSGGGRISIAQPSRPPSSLRGYEASFGAASSAKPRPPAEAKPSSSSPAPPSAEGPQRVSAPLPPAKATAATTPDAARARGTRDEEVVEKTLPAATAAVPKKASRDGASGDDARAVASDASPAASALVARVSASKMSTRRGLALALLVVIIATAPLWLRAINRMLRGHASTTEPGVTSVTSRPPTAEPPPSPAAPPSATPR